MNYQAIIDDSAGWVSKYIKQYQNATLCFHNITHTMQVVEATKKIGTYYQLSERDFCIVLVAAYFHDIGYYTGPADGHERRSAEIAASFLEEKAVDNETIEAVKNCIQATRVPQKPQNLLEEIVCDADLFHFGSAEFPDRNKLMHREFESCKNQHVSKDDWRIGTIAMMENHHYHTQYAQLFLNETKMKNLKSLKEKADKSIVTDKEKQEKKKEKSRPDRGIETMFRVTSTNNQRLSDMADNKANILITVNSIILSVIIALLIRKLDSNEHLIIPTIVLLAVSLSTMVVAILATRPYIPDGRFSEQDMTEKKVNLLFFGNFYRMDIKEYNAGMRIVMEDRDFLYGTLIKDVYSQGVVLGRKYRLLRIAYSIFMYGLIAAVFAFLSVTIGYM